MDRPGEKESQESVLTEQQRRGLTSRVPSLAAIVVGVVLGLSPVPSTAQTLAWDPSPDPTVVGYRVRYGAVASSLYAAIDVGPQREMSLQWWSRDRAWFFCVEAYNADQFTSACSDIVVLTPSQGAGRPIESYDEWAARLSAGLPTADPDKDGVVNEQEFLSQTDPNVPNRWLFAEGATGTFIEDLALANPGDDSAIVRLRYLRAGQAPIESVAALGPKARTTVTVNYVPGLASASAAVELTTTYGAVLAERTMSWWSPDGARPTHSAKAVAAPSSQWYFAEGEARLTDTWFLVANANASPTRVTFEFLTDAGTRVQRSYDVGAESRFTVWANAIPELAGRSFATTVKASLPVITERAVYFWSNAHGWRGGHVSAGATAPSRRWFVAEGHTGEFFDTYVLIGNPNTVPTTVTLRYLTPRGLASTDTITIAAQSRLTVPVDLVPGLESTDVSVDVSASQPIVVERSMYWPGDARSWRDGHNSIALDQLGTRWVLPEGRWNDEQGTESYVLVANPNASAAAVTLNVLRESGRPPLVVTLQLAPNTRETLRIDDAVGLSPGERFAVEVQSSQPIAVEHSIYTSVGGFWTGGSNETGIRLR